VAITRQDIEKVAELARLDLTPEEAAAFTSQMGSILTYIEKLNELDTTGVEPVSHARSNLSEAEHTRPDIVGPCLGQKLATENAPDPQAGYFGVPRVIGGDQ
jgi:aspartyl-tRNA(Asn)/glutamyl-tRNA(Gln) amidotransferase subunit C